MSQVLPKVRPVDDPIDLLLPDAPIMMHSIDARGVLLRVSPFWAKALGYAPEDMIGRRSTEFLTEESRALAMGTVLPMFRATGKVSNVEYDFRRKDGSVLPVLLSATSQFDENGTFLRSMAIMIDHTEARRARVLLEQKLRDEAVGKLAAGVAHDFNNLLSVILGNLEFLRDVPDHPDRDDMIADALNATRRGATLTQQLVSYGRRAQLSPAALRLEDILRDMGAMFQRVLPPRITLSIAVEPDLPEVVIDRRQLETALINVVDNAREAIAGIGQVRITAERAEAAADGRPQVRLSVSDTGQGMNDATTSHAFEPFFTTKPVGAGSGLGLSMVFGFVKQSRGTVDLASAPGTGTTLSMIFPAEGPVVPPRALPEAVDTAGARPGQVQVLLVEDQPEVRRVVSAHLRSAGHRVVEASSGDGAQRLLDHGLRPDLVVTDLTMPGALQGEHVLQAAQALVPGVRGIVISGHLGPTPEADGPTLRQALWLTKPVSRDLLLASVRSLCAPAADAQRRTGTGG